MSIYKIHTNLQDSLNARNITLITDSNGTILFNNLLQ